MYIIEVNPRSSRTVPFLTKATGYPLADIATRVALGRSLREQGLVSGSEAKKIAARLRVQLGADIIISL